MFKTLYELLIKDTGWKLLSLGLAVILWLVGMNINNPMETRAFNRALTLSNKEVLARDNVVILNERLLESTLIKINVRATQSDLNMLSAQTNNIVPSIDLRAINTSQVLQSDVPVEVPVDVYVNIMPGFERMNSWPVNVMVVLDRKVNQTKNILVHAVGEVQEGYELQKVSGKNETVVVSGAKSLVDKVHTVRVQENIQGANQDIARLEKLYAYDVDDNDITDTVTLSVTETMVHVSVLPYKTVPLEVLMTGMPASSYTVTEVITDPQTIEIVGTQEALDEISVITLTTLNLDNASGEVTGTFDIRKALADLPVNLRKDTREEAEVTVKLERQIMREFTFSTDQIRISGYPVNTTVQLLGDNTVTIAVRGLEPAVKDLTMDRIGVQLNLYGLEPGDHEMPLTITLPRGFALVGNPPNVEVMIQPVSATESPDTESGTPADDSSEPDEVSDNNGG